MKQFIGLLVATGLALGASAQKTKINESILHASRPSNAKTRVVVVSPVYGGWYSPYYSRFNRWGYDPFGYYPYYGFRSASVDVPTELDLEIAKIRNDYGHEISEIRHDKSISKAERKQKIRDLKHERENAIIDAKADYYKGREKQ